MSSYYVNKNTQSNGDHEVHKTGCSSMPSEMNRLYLGTFRYCMDAVKEARKYYSKVNGCKWCSMSCHTG